MNLTHLSMIPSLPLTDPFALVARDEHLRYVDPRYAKQVNAADGDDFSSVGSIGAETDALSLHAELGGLVKHALHPPQAHLPTLVEGERFAADLESGLNSAMGKKMRFSFEETICFSLAIKILLVYLIKSRLFFFFLCAQERQKGRKRRKKNNLRTFAPLRLLF